jgi:hypothetical protein
VEVEEEWEVEEVEVEVEVEVEIWEEVEVVSRCRSSRKVREALL